MLTKYKTFPAIHFFLDILNNVYVSLCEVNGISDTNTKTARNNATGAYRSQLE